MPPHREFANICAMPPRLPFFFPLILGLLSAPLHAAQVTLAIADITAPSLAAQGIRLLLPEDGSAELNIAELHVAEQKWLKVRVHCGEFSLGTVQVACRKGRLDAVPDLSFEFLYNFSSQHLELALTSVNHEQLLASADLKAQPWRADVRLHSLQGKRLAAFLPASWPALTQGMLGGTLALQGDASGVLRAEADMQMSEIAFADASGLHAAEKLAGKLSLNAVRSGAQWDWRGNFDWQGGELFWQPLYLRGGHTLQAAGQWDGARLKVARAVAQLSEVGQFELSASWDARKSELLECSLRGGNLVLERLFADYAKPFLGGSVLAASEISGRGDMDWQYRNGATQAFAIVLRDAVLQDGQERFSLRGVNADIPWRADAQTQASMAFSGGALWGVPLGAAAVKVAMRGLEFSVDDAILPVLEGRLVLHNFHLHREQDEWQWNFSGGLELVSMRSLSAALHWPEMQGALSGAIPRVSYANGLLRVDGALLFHVFDGTVEANHLALYDPFGRAPRLSGSLDMRDLNLDLLTRTFSFGNMQGRIDASVKNLELVNWQPFRFDARIASSAGEYPRKISQKAVQNISALGGSGGMAALQRSYLRFFENFGYDRIALSCMLRNGVCAMDGVEPVGGGYVIVKGGGIPAINVVGYNRNVDWNELLTRLQRVMQNNVQAVVK